MELTLVPLPLIKCSYMPDLINLSEDKGARQHWIQRFMEALSHVNELSISKEKYVTFRRLPIWPLHANFRPMTSTQELSNSSTNTKSSSLD